MSRALRVALAFAIATSPATALADKKAARPHLERASSLYAATKYRDALTELTLAYTLDPDPGILFAIGQVHVKLGDCDNATAFYQRFLDSKPAEDEAAVAREAIEKCAYAARKTESETNATAKPEPEPKPEPAPTPPPAVPTPVPPPEPAAPHPDISAEPTTEAWYSDRLGDGLAIVGLAAGAAGGLLYGAALSARSDADHATTYQGYNDELDRAHSLRTYSVLAAAGGVALVGAGIARYALHDRSEHHAVAATPTRSGALVTYEVRF
ncbi:MAG TPA: hypothetical protein VMJ10_27090 [Kofleriaceae bacterium]|nr:hypothetical protein [Kofleriaceae bacterium]